MTKSKKKQQEKKFKPGDEVEFTPRKDAHIPHRCRGKVVYVEGPSGSRSDLVRVAFLMEEEWTVHESELKKAATK